MNSNLENEAKVWRKISKFVTLSFVCSALDAFSLYISPLYYMHRNACWFIALNWFLSFFAITFCLIAITIISKNKMWPKISGLAAFSFICGVIGITLFSFLVHVLGGGLFPSIFALLAIAFGICGIIAISLSRGSLKGVEFAIIGIILGSAYIFIIFPSLIF